MITKETIYNDLKTKLNIFKNSSIKSMLKNNDFYIIEDKVTSRYLLPQKGVNQYKKGYEQFVNLEQFGQLRCYTLPLRTFMKIKDKDECYVFFSKKNEFLYIYTKERELDKELKKLIKK